jgi:hypothetical protein
MTTDAVAYCLQDDSLNMNRSMDLVCRQQLINDIYRYTNSIKTGVDAMHVILNFSPVFSNTHLHSINQSQSSSPASRAHAPIAIERVHN